MAVVITAGAVDLDREGRDPAYVESIVKRSQKIVDKLELTDTVAAREVTTIIANRYFKLNDIYETRDAKVKLAKETLTGDAKQEAVKAAEAEKDAALYRTHFAFPADLSLYLDAKHPVCARSQPGNAPVVTPFVCRWLGGSPVGFSAAAHE